MADVVPGDFAVVLPHDRVPSNSLEIFKTMDWFILVFLPFKLLVLATGMFFAIKWHHDQEKQKKK
ncbi:hypothetical protein QTL95_14820 [Rhizobium sp. S152]|uniref:hypothetical protein n=1 Tax=Rhizobium sp. S152 TaxID=3055038 RepID=UPI0025AA16B6|nr:hypothetical protein [Rhizobium sp. S152]MDM9627179.1 hypothetical protein [Rhizobium sp. S152]